MGNYDKTNVPEGLCRLCWYHDIDAQAVEGTDLCEECLEKEND